MPIQQASVNISLPERMRSWVEERVAAEGYGTVSEYFRALVREEQKRKAREALDQKLLEALDSGGAAELTPDDWNKMRTTVRRRLAAKGRKRK